MKKYLLAVCLALLQLGALAAEPSAESIERLLEASQGQRQIEAILKQLDGVMRGSFESAIDMRSLTPERRESAQRFFRSFAEKMGPLITEELSWERMKQTLVQIYRESLSQEEVDGLIEFYAGPLGRALIEKMPLITQKSIAMMQQRMPALVERIGRAAQETAREFKAELSRRPPTPS